MPGGYGAEWIQVDFPGAADHPARPLRVSAVGMRIPPLPSGPLSVRRFFLQARRSAHAGEDTWDTHETWALETLDRPEMQWLSLTPPVESTSVRVVMTMNAAAAFELEGVEAASRARHCDCVGLFQIDFR